MRDFVFVIAIVLIVFIIPETLIVNHSRTCLGFQDSEMSFLENSRTAKIKKSLSSQIKSPFKNPNDDTQHQLSKCSVLSTFDGTFNFGKSVDANGDGVYIDDGKTIEAGDKISFELDWSYNAGTDPLDQAFVADEVPVGTTYLSGSATNHNLEHSLDNGLTWNPGEPPNGAPAGTKLRWNVTEPYWATIDGKPYDPTNENAHVSQSSAQPALAFNKLNKPALVYSDYARTYDEYDIVNTIWNGSQWVGANAFPYNHEIAENGTVNPMVTESDGASLVFDLNNRPCVAWGERIDPAVITSWEIFYARWNGTQWVNVQGDALSGLNGIVSNTPSTSYGVSLAIDSKGFPNLVWYDYTGVSFSFDIFFVRWNGSSWVNVSGAVYDGSNAKVSNTTSSSEFPCLKLDGNDMPCVSWSEGLFGGYDVMFVRWDGSQWVGANGLPYNPGTGANGNVSMNPAMSGYPALDLDSNGNPCVSWHDYSYGAGTDIICVRWNGAMWVGGNGLPYNNLTGANGIVARSAFIPNGTTINKMSSKMTSVDFDGNDNIHLAFWCEMAGNKGVYYTQTSGAGWLGANGKPFDGITGQNGWTQAGIQCVYTNYATAVSIDHDSNNLPYIAWYTQTPDYYAVSLIRYSPLSQTRSFRFSAVVDDPVSPVITYVKNIATFDHSLDNGVPLQSDTVILNLKGSETIEGNGLKVTKTSKSFSYNAGDEMEFSISVTNTGTETLSGVILTDSFPRELAYVSSQPSGLAGMSTVKYELGMLDPGESEIVKILFNARKGLTIDDCLTLTNEAVAQSGSIVSKNSCIFKICNPKAPEPLSLNVSWVGIDTHTGVGNIGKPILILAKVTGGSSPYDLYYDWGTGRTMLGGQSDGDEIPAVVIQDLDPGEYKFLIKCVDAYGGTKTVTRNVMMK